MKLRDVNTIDLIKELKARDGIRYVTVSKDERFKTEIHGDEEKHKRHIRGWGPLTIMECMENEEYLCK